MSTSATCHETTSLNITTRSRSCARPRRHSPQHHRARDARRRVARRDLRSRLGPRRSAVPRSPPREPVRLDGRRARPWRSPRAAGSRRHSVLSRVERNPTRGPRRAAGRAPALRARPVLGARLPPPATASPPRVQLWGQDSRSNPDNCALGRWEEVSRDSCPVGAARRARAR